jgi:hypothetical protein
MDIWSAYWATGGEDGGRDASPFFFVFFAFLAGRGGVDIDWARFR